MALDIRARASVSGLFLPAFAVGIRPNAALDQQSRQSAGWGYSGVLAGSAVVAAIGVAIMSAGHFIYQRHGHGTGQGVSLRM